ncbi:alpha/beta hydrolase [Agrobacterium vitis]|uniref:alpha/beta hydrolase n=1 Tax=Agrobacterium vitis TaxID=373 RepID=UPI003D282176
MYQMVRRFLGSMSHTGTFIALVFFAASLTPSLMPRSYLVQGALSGVCAAVGYMAGVAVGWLWSYLELPRESRRERPLTVAFLVVAILISSVFLWHAVEWQNSIRVLWRMDALDSAEPLKLAFVAILAFVVLLITGRLFQLAARGLSRWINRYVPRRVASALGVTLAALLFWTAGQGLLLRWALDATDASFQKVDALIDDDTPAPTDQAKTGSASSLISWEGLGLQGRRFVSSGPTAPDIGAFWQQTADEPIRAYIGLNNGDTVEARAALALKELQRQGGFDRSILVIIVPTGTGWVDPAAMDTLEFLHRGDVASVALQYSYLASWLSLMVEPDNGQAAARALFTEVYDHWKTLPRKQRPKLYLYGLSLGALNSQLSTDIYDVVADPFQGALWSGPPFRSERWRAITNQRQTGSPAWLPRFRDGSVVRFSNQTMTPSQYDAAWGPIRFIYLQYASDPIVFFETSSFFKEPDWMQGQRGPDVSPQFRWVPVVTMLQLAFDMAIGTTSPIGFGHVYAPEDYIDSWIALTDPPDMDHSAVEQLKKRFAK